MTQANTPTSGTGPSSGSPATGDPMQHSGDAQNAENISGQNGDSEGASWQSAPAATSYANAQGASGATGSGISFADFCGNCDGLQKGNDTSGDIQIAAASSGGVMGSLGRIIRDLGDYAAELTGNETKWAEMGKRGEAAAEAEITARGYIIVGRQIYVKTPLGARITDFLVTGGPLGKGLGGIEVKVNGAGRTPLQVQKDAFIGTSGGAQVYHPQCQACSNRQGGLVRGIQQQPGGP